MYQLLPNFMGQPAQCIKRLADNAFIPADNGNRDWREYQEWLEAGNTPLLPTPNSVTWEQIRAQRDQLLLESDWAIISDATPKPNKETWLAYRQALRNVPQTFASPESVIWPTKPA